MMLPCVWTTPLGLPVVPLVYKMSAGSWPKRKDMKNKWWMRKWHHIATKRLYSIQYKSWNCDIILDLSMVSRKILSASIFPFCECSSLLFSNDLLATGGRWKNWEEVLLAMFCINSLWSSVLSIADVSYIQFIIKFLLNLIHRTKLKHNGRAE